ncbi:myosin light chain alkali, putative [Pediculus humanus corporis]|uniref:Myosin light chain alkali n=1 Tax=Pediculus humanus subsp. corporis TaxID=121224 RepID=E0VJH0_PEDHC|nr:myosin light chain alkali, putative [Pediculus humanus corporis]EEB13526.1 myosin light chain alkali, putative [Pediculus humanus corporis]
MRANFPNFYLNLSLVTCSLLLIQETNINNLLKQQHNGANFAFSIYDLDGSGTVDAFYLGDVLRGLNLNPTNATIEKLGGTKKKGEKTLKVDEFLPIFSQCKKDKDHGGYEDFLECLKLYDKAENGLMLGAELSHTLLALGERLTDAECDEIMKDCCPAEDDEGFIDYAAFLKKLVANQV